MAEFSDRCAACNAQWNYQETPGNRDGVLDGLLDNLVRQATALGKCYVDPIRFGEVPGSLAEPRQWHSDKKFDVDVLKLAIHNHIKLNYERDD